MGEAVRREGADWAVEKISEVGEIAGRADVIELGRLANENPPKLRTHDRYGNRVDEAEFHPAWHELMRLGISHELHSLPWREPQPGAHVARAAAFMCFSQAEAGVGCPISMTYSVVPALRKQPELAEEWEPRILSDVYDPRQIAASEKEGSLFGMGMTEKQGGSDVRANTTVGRPINGGGPGAEYELTGHKWFFSAPQCDAFLVLAQAEGGVSCFLMPAPPAGRRAQPLPPAAAQGQARQPLQRLLRDRVRRRLGAPGRRGGRGRPDDHRDGQPHPARLRVRQRHRDAPRRRPGDQPRRPPLHLRQAPGRRSR